MTFEGREDEVEELLLERDVRQFLHREAELLDSRQLHDWLDLIADDISYRMPRRLMHENTAQAFSENGYYFNEDRGSLEARVKRFDSEYAWAERPPTRTERHVTNVQVTDQESDKVEVTNNLLVYLSKGDSPEHTFYSVKRNDVLRQQNDTFEIADREILLNQTVLDTNNISILL